MLSGGGEAPCTLALGQLSALAVAAEPSRPCRRVGAVFGMTFPPTRADDFRLKALPEHLRQGGRTEAAFHSISSSARASSEDGIVRPCALAVLRSGACQSFPYCL